MVKRGRARVFLRNSALTGTMTAGNNLQREADRMVMIENLEARPLEYFTSVTRDKLITADLVTNAEHESYEYNCYSKEVSFIVAKPSAWSETYSVAIFASNIRSLQSL